MAVARTCDICGKMMSHNYMRGDKNITVYHGDSNSNDSNRDEYDVCSDYYKEFEDLVCKIKMSSHISKFGGK